MTNIDEKLLSNKNLVRMQAFSIENPAEIGKTPPKNHKICQDLPKFVKFGNFLANFQQRNKKKHPMCPCETFKRWPKLILQYISGSCEKKMRKLQKNAELRLSIPSGQNWFMLKIDMIFLSLGDPSQNQNVHQFCS